MTEFKDQIVDQIDTTFDQQSGALTAMKVSRLGAIGFNKPVPIKIDGDDALPALLAAVLLLAAERDAFFAVTALERGLDFFAVRFGMRELSSEYRAAKKQLRPPRVQHNYVRGRSPGLRGALERRAFPVLSSTGIVAS